MNIAAYFTPHDNTLLVLCERQHCPIKLLPPGTQLHYIDPIEDEVTGRKVCDACYNYYMSKAGTISRNAKKKQQPQLTRTEVHKGIARSQRGEPGTAAIQHVGAGYGAMVTQQSMLPPQMPMNYGPVYHQAATQGPAVHLPGFGYPPNPFQKNHGQVQQGYTNAHARHGELTNSMQKNAYAGGASGAQGHIWSAKITIMVVRPGKNNALQVADLTDALGNLPVNILTEDLKVACFKHILSRWNKYSKDYPLDINQLKVGQLPVFKSGVYKLYFEIPYDLLQLVEQHIEEVEYGGSLVKSYPQSSSSKSSKRSFQQIRSPSKPKPKGKGKAKSVATQKKIAAVESSSESDSENQSNSGFEDRPTTPPSKHPRLITATSPDKVLLHKALLVQKHIQSRDLSTFFAKKMISVLIFPIQMRSVDELMKFPEWDSLLGKPFAATLSLEDSGQKGGFKIAFFGTSDVPLFPNSSSLDICAKQTYHTEVKEVQAKHITQHIPHDSRRQTQNLMMEGTCLVWGGALMQLTYAVIDKINQRKGVPSFPVPSMHFVSVCMDVEQTAQRPRVFLVEERIATSEGKFRKFINNDDPVPRLFFHDDNDTADGITDKIRGAFLAFSQHVQYVKTHNYVFVSDYQGGNESLTDPQILSHSSLGYIFSDGNLPAGFDEFPERHECNHFCKFYELKPLDQEQSDSENTINNSKPADTEHTKKTTNKERTKKTMKKTPSSSSNVIDLTGSSMAPGLGLHRALTQVTLSHGSKAMEMSAGPSQPRTKARPSRAHRDDC